MTKRIRGQQIGRERQPDTIYAAYHNTTDGDVGIDEALWRKVGCPDISPETFGFHRITVGGAYVHIPKDAIWEDPAAVFRLVMENGGHARQVYIAWPDSPENQQKVNALKARDNGVMDTFRTTMKYVDQAGQEHSVTRIGVVGIPQSVLRDVSDEVHDRRLNPGVAMRLSAELENAQQRIAELEAEKSTAAVAKEILDENQRLRAKLDELQQAQLQDAAKTAASNARKSLRTSAPDLASEG